MSRDVVVVDGVRTPYAKAGTELKDVSAAELGRIAMTELLARTNLDPAGLDQVVFGNIAQPAEAVNITRVAALSAGVPERVPAFTVHRICGSGLESMVDAATGSRPATQTPCWRAASSPCARSRSCTPTTARSFTEVFTAKDLGAKLVAASKFRTRIQARIALALGLTDPVCGLNMGETAEVLAREHRIAPTAGRVRVELPPARDPRAREASRGDRAGADPARLRAWRRDNGLREGQTIEALAKLKPYFDRRYGTVTAGNSSQITDGGAAVLVMSAGAAKAAATGRSDGSAASRSARSSPSAWASDPAVATPLALKNAGVSWADIGLVEINEAFAAQVLACARRLPSGPGTSATAPAGRSARSTGSAPTSTAVRSRSATGRILGEPAGADAAQGDAAPRHAVRARHDVHRRRSGRRDRGGAAVNPSVIPRSEATRDPRLDTLPGARGRIPRCARNDMEMTMSAFDLRIEEDGLAVLTFDLPGEKVNKLSSPVVAELADVLVRLDPEPRIRALLLRSGKPDVFVAGEDVQELAAVAPDDVGTAVERVQSLFEQLANLRYRPSPRSTARASAAEPSSRSPATTA